MTRDEFIILRMNILGGMNEYLINNVQDEEIIVDIWFAEGVPDGATEDDLRSIAEDEELWLDTINCFAKCAKYAELI